MSLGCSLHIRKCLLSKTCTSFMLPALLLLYWLLIHTDRSLIEHCLQWLDPKEDKIHGVRVQKPKCQLPMSQNRISNSSSGSASWSRWVDHLRDYTMDNCKLLFRRNLKFFSCTSFMLPTLLLLYWLLIQICHSLMDHPLQWLYIKEVEIHGVRAQNPKPQPPMSHNYIFQLL